MEVLAVSAPVFEKRIEIIIRITGVGTQISFQKDFFHFSIAPIVIERRAVENLNLSS